MFPRLGFWSRIRPTSHAQIDRRREDTAWPDLDCQIVFTPEGRRQLIRRLCTRSVAFDTSSLSTSTRSLPDEHGCFPTKDSQQFALNQEHTDHAAALDYFYPRVSSRRVPSQSAQHRVLHKHIYIYIWGHMPRIVGMRLLHRGSDRWHDSLGMCPETVVLDLLHAAASCMLSGMQ